MTNEARALDLLQRIADAADEMSWQPDPRGGWSAHGVRVYDDPVRQEAVAIRRQRGITVEFHALEWRLSETGSHHLVLRIWDAAFATALDAAEMELNRTSIE